MPPKQLKRKKTTLKTKKKNRKSKDDDKQPLREDKELLESYNTSPPVPMKGELRVMLDNFNQSASAPAVTGLSTKPAESTSTLQVSVSKVVYKETQTSSSEVLRIAAAPNQVQTTTSSAALITNDMTDFGSDILSLADCECDICLKHTRCHESKCLCNTHQDSSALLRPGAAEQSSGSSKCCCRQQTTHRRQSLKWSVNDKRHDNNNYRQEFRGHGQEKINRYNFNHLQYLRSPSTNRKSRKWSLMSLLKPKGANKKLKDNLQFAAVKNIASKQEQDTEISNGSGITIPQLYKANISRTVAGVTPGKFTFRAVTGCPSLFEISAPKSDTKSTDGVLNEMYYVSEQARNENANTSKSDYPLLITADNDVTGTASDVSTARKQHTARKCRDHLKLYKSHDDYVGKTDYLLTRAAPERIDIYCFDHLNTGYFRTTDHPPPLLSEIALERVEAHATKFWAEVFGCIHLFNAFIIAFFLQFYKFLLYGIIRPIFVGLVQLTSDYLIKPLLTVTYNGFIQPAFIFLYNILTSFRDLCLPLSRAMGYFLNEIAVVLRAIRLMEWRNTSVNRSTSTGSLKQV